jgi:hypothetical protein
MTVIADVPDRGLGVVSGKDVASTAVSWAAIVAGAVAAIAITIVLLVLGSGIGLTMVSPWYNAGASATTVGVSAVIGVVVVQWISAGLGGFLAGRLRTKWVGLHTHEVFFRDTAHGFMAWAAASVVGALLFASVTAAGVSGVAGGAKDIAAAGAAGAAQGGAQHAGKMGGGDPSAYFTDSLFRSATPAQSSATTQGDKGEQTAEAGRILMHSVQGGQIVLAPADKTYLGQLVAARTGLAQPDAEQRVDTVVAQLNDAQMKARQAADTARKAAAKLSIVIALSMLIGAFIAAAAGALGGSYRDEY